MIGVGVGLGIGDLPVRARIKELIDMGWSVAGLWNHSVDGDSASAVFDITGASDVLVDMAFVHSTLSSILAIELSADGGVTWFTTDGDYRSIEANGTTPTTPNIPLHINSATGSRSAVAIMYHNVEGRRKFFNVINTGVVYHTPGGVAFTHLRVRPSSGNLSSGSIQVMTKS